MSISIVMTSYKRATQLRRTLDSIAMQTVRPDQIVIVEDGQDEETAGVCAVARMHHGLPIEYIERRNRPDLSYSNPAVPKNIGIKKAIGDIMIIQCAEVRYTGVNDIKNLVQPLRESRGVSSIATVKAMDALDGFQEWYAGPGRASGWFLDFCQATHRQDVLNIGGFEEDYKGYGFDDDDFALRMQAAGIQYRWALDVVCEHQWHPILPKDVALSEWGRHLYDCAKFDIENKKRGMQANIGRNWGDPNS